MEERNKMVGRGLYLFARNPAQSLKARVPGICEHLEKSSLTLAPASYGIGASSAELTDMVRWAVETNSKLYVSTGHYGDDEGEGVFFEELTSKEMRVLLGEERTLNGYAIPETASGLLIYSARAWAESRETMLKSIVFSLEGFGNEDWVAAGVGPSPEEIRGLFPRMKKMTEVIKTSVGILLGSRAFIASRALKKVRKNLEALIK